MAFEDQDLGALFSIAIGTGVGLTAAKVKGLGQKDFNAIKASKPIRPASSASQSLTASMASQIRSRDQKKSSVKAQRLQEAANILSQNSYSQNYDIIRSSFIEALSSPSVSKSLPPSMPSMGDIMDELYKAGSDPEEVRNIVQRYRPMLVQSAPDFETIFEQSVSSKTGRTYKGQSYNSLISGQSKFVEVRRTISHDRVKQLNMSQVAGQEMFSEFRNLISQAIDRKLLSDVDLSGNVDDVISRLTAKGAFFSINDGTEQATFARLRLGGSEVNIPLRRNRVRVGGQDVGTYFADTKGNSRVSFTGNFANLEKTPGSSYRLSTNADGSLKMFGFEEAIFYGHSGEMPILDKAAQAQKTGVDIMRLIASPDEFVDGDKFGQYTNLTRTEGLSVALKKQSQMVVLGIKPLLEDVGDAKGYTEIEEQIRKLSNGRITPLPLDSPAAVGKVGAFQIKDSQNPGLGLSGLLYEAEAVEGIRGPLKLLNQPWGVIPDPSSKASLFQSPMLETETAEKLRLQKGRFGESLAPVNPLMVLEHLDDDELIGSRFNLGLGEGEFLLNKDISEEFISTSKQSDEILVDRSSGKSLLANKIADATVDINGRSVPLLEAIEMATTDEQRSELIRKSSLGSETWTEGQFLGKTKTASGQIKDSFLGIGGEGDILLSDIKPTNDGFKFLFSRKRRGLEGTKTFGPLKGMITDRSRAVGAAMSRRQARYIADIERETGLPELVGRANIIGDSKELLKNQPLYRRTQQVTVLAEINPDLKDSSASLLTYNPSDPTFQRLARFGASTNRSNELFEALGGRAGMADELLGTLKLAAAADITDSKELGAIFSAEKKAMRGVLEDAQLSQELGHITGVDMTALKEGINTSKYVIGRLPVMIRDEGHAYMNSRPSIERRAVQSLLSSDIEEVANFNVKKALLSDIVQGARVPDDDFVHAVKSIAQQYKDAPKLPSFTVGGDNSLGIDDVIERRGVIDVREALAGIPGYNPGSGKLVVPSERDRLKLEGLIDTGGDNLIDGSYSRSLEAFVHEAANFDPDSKESKENLARTYEAAKRIEIANAMKVSSGVIGADIQHSNYQMITGQAFEGQGVRQADGSVIKTSKGGGVSFGMSKSQIIEMFSRAKSVALDDSQIKMLDNQMKAVLEQGKYGAMAISRPPAINEVSRAMFAFHYDEEMDRVELRDPTPKEIEKQKKRANEAFERYKNRKLRAADKQEQRINQSIKARVGARRKVEEERLAKNLQRIDEMFKERTRATYARFSKYNAIIESRKRAKISQIKRRNNLGESRTSESPLLMRPPERMEERHKEARALILREYDQRIESQALRMSVTEEELRDSRLQQARSLVEAQRMEGPEGQVARASVEKLKRELSANTDRRVIQAFAYSDISISALRDEIKASPPSGVQDSAVDSVFKTAVESESALTDKIEKAKAEIERVMGPRRARELDAFDEASKRAIHRVRMESQKRFKNNRKKRNIAQDKLERDSARQARARKRRNAIRERNLKKAEAIKAKIRNRSSERLKNYEERLQKNRDRRLQKMRDVQPREFEARQVSTRTGGADNRLAAPSVAVEYTKDGKTRTARLDPGYLFASSWDFDGDRVAFNLIMGDMSADAFNAINDSRFRDSLLQEYIPRVLKSKALAEAMDRQIESIYGSTNDLSDFANHQNKLAGQKQIGPLSVEVDRMRHAVRIAADLGGIDKALKGTLLSMLGTMEQGAVSFKAIGTKSPAEDLTRQLSAVLDKSSVTEARLDGLKTLLTQWFGEDIFGAGVSTDVEGDALQVLGADQKVSVSLTDDQLKGMSQALDLMSTPEMRAAFDQIRKKVESISDTNVSVLEQRRAASEAMADFVPGLRSVVANLLEQEGYSPAEVDEYLKNAGSEALSELNKRTLEAGKKAAVNRLASKLSGPIMMGLATATGIYSLFDSGYSREVLEAPGPSPSGHMPQSSIAVRQAVEEGRLLQNNGPGNYDGPPPGQEMAWGGAGPNGRDVGMPEANSHSQPPNNPSSIPTRSFVDGSTGRINVRGVVPGNIDMNEMSHHLRMLMPNASVGVNVSHQYNIPRDLEGRI